METEKFNPNNLTGSLPEGDELDFDLAGMESYYERRILKVGQGVLSIASVDVKE